MRKMIEQRPNLAAVVCAAITITSMGLAVSLAVPPRNYWTPASGVVGNNQFVCPDFAPTPNTCTNQGHPHYFLQSNLATTNKWEQPGGQGGMRMRQGR